MLAHFGYAADLGLLAVSLLCGWDAIATVFPRLRAAHLDDSRVTMVVTSETTSSETETSLSSYSGDLATQTISPDEPGLPKYKECHIVWSWLPFG